MTQVFGVILLSQIPLQINNTSGITLRNDDVIDIDNTDNTNNTPSKRVVNKDRVIKGGTAKTIDNHNGTEMIKPGTRGLLETIQSLLQLTNKMLMTGNNIARGAEPYRPPRGDPYEERNS
ncbi:hypothetical protein CsSME_00027277 [Camellia sinensis var. sinensis]